MATGAAIPPPAAANFMGAAANMTEGAPPPAAAAAGGNMGAATGAVWPPGANGLVAGAAAGFSFWGLGGGFFWLMFNMPGEAEGMPPGKAKGFAICSWVTQTALETAAVRKATKVRGSAPARLSDEQNRLPEVLARNITLERWRG